MFWKRFWLEQFEQLGILVSWYSVSINVNLYCTKDPEPPKVSVPRCRNTTQDVIQSDRIIELFKSGLQPSNATDVERNARNARPLRSFWRKWRRLREKSAQASMQRMQWTQESTPWKQWTLPTQVAQAMQQPKRNDRRGVCSFVACVAYAALHALR